MKLWGLYWRYLLSTSLLLALTAFLIEQLNLLAAVKNKNLIPSYFWGTIALFFILIGLLQTRGLPYLFFGKRLQLDINAWRQYKHFISSLFVVLAALGFIVGYLFDSELWSLYKLYGQPACLICIPLFGAWFITKDLKS